MHRTIKVAAVILACAGFFILHAGCGGSDDPSDPGGGGGCGIDITTPDPGDVFRSGQSLTLRWDASGGGDVRLTLLKAGAEQGVIAAATENDGYYRWTVTTMGAAGGTDFGLAVTHTSKDCADTLAIELVNTEGCAFEATFLPANPTRTDTVQAGDDYEITWTSENTTGVVDISLRYYTGVQHEEIAALALGTADDGSFLWENVDSFHNGTSNNYYVRIADAAVDGCDTDSRHFRIVDEEICEIEVMEPGDSDVYDEGQQMLVRFSTTNDSGRVDLYLYEGYVNLVEYMVADVPTLDGQVNWTVDLPDGYEGSLTFFRVKVVDANDGNCVGFSPSFTINRAP
jgi:hypothetical protein